MYSTAVGPQFRITFLFWVHSLLLPFCSCVTEKSQEADFDLEELLKPYTFGPWPWEKTLGPDIWGRTRGPYPWERTRGPFPWERTRGPYRWEITNEPFPYNRKTLNPYPWDVKKPIIDYKDDYNNYKRTDTALKLVIFIPPFVILSIFLVCKYCVINKARNDILSTTTHAPPRRHSFTTESSGERRGVSTIFNSNGREHLQQTTATSFEKPPDYTAVILSDRSEPTPRYPSVIIEDDDERPPSYHDAQVLSKY